MCLLSSGSFGSATAAPHLSLGLPVNVLFIPFPTSPPPPPPPQVHLHYRGLSQYKLRPPSFIRGHELYGGEVVHANVRSAGGSQQERP